MPDKMGTNILTLMVFQKEFFEKVYVGKESAGNEKILRKLWLGQNFFIS